MRLARLGARVLIALAAFGLVTTARAEVDEVTLAKQFGIGSLTFLVMEHEKLYEKAVAAANIGHPVAVRWVRFTGGGAMNDAMLSGDLSFALAGIGPLATMWAKTHGNLGVMGVCGANSMPMLLNTRDAQVKSIRDFTSRNKIALPGVKVSIQAILLEMAAAKAFGDGAYARLDPLTLTMYIRFTLVPQGTMKVVSFMYQQGRIKLQPKAWTDLFFPEVHDLPGT